MGIVWRWLSGDWAEKVDEYGMGWGIPQKGVRKCNTEGVRAGNGSEFWVPGGGCVPGQEVPLGG